MTVVPVRTSSQNRHQEFLGRCQSPRISRGIGARASHPALGERAVGLLCVFSLLFVRAAGRGLHAVDARFGGWRRAVLDAGRGCRSWRPLSAQRAAVAAATISAATSGCRMSEWAPANEDWDVSQMTVFASAR